MSPEATHLAGLYHAREHLHSLTGRAATLTACSLAPVPQVTGQRLERPGTHRTIAGADSVITCAAPKPAASGKPSAATVATRQEPPDQPIPK